MSIIFNQALVPGALAPSTDTYEALLLTEHTGADGADADDDTVTALLAHANVVEAAHTNYARVTLTGVAASVNDVDDRGELTSDNITFPALAYGDGSPAAVTAVVICRVDGAGDGNRVPLYLDDTNFPVAPDGNNYRVTVTRLLDFVQAP